MHTKFSKIKQAPKVIFCLNKEIKKVQNCSFDRSFTVSRNPGLAGTTMLHYLTGSAASRRSTTKSNFVQAVQIVQI